MAVFKSGAFLQQCFSVHPLTLNLKLVTPPELVGIVCTNCRMKHRLMVRTKLEFQKSAHKTTDDEEISLLHQCSQAHPDDVRVTSVDVVKSSVELRCRPCRRSYLLDVATIETHQS